MSEHPQLRRIRVKNGDVFIDDKLQTNIDGRSCKIIFPEKGGRDYDFNAIYLSDKNAVYFVSLKSRSQRVHIRKITSDILNFKVVNDGALSKDRAHVYLHGKPLEEVDASTFELIPSLYFAKDSNHVYYHNNFEPYFMKLLCADPKTFVSFKDRYGNYSGFASDKDNLYFNWRLSNDQKWAWFEKGSIYKSGKMILTSFRDSDHRTSCFLKKNLSGYWWNDDYAKKPQDCRPIGKFHYAKSATAVYTKNVAYDTPELISGADPDSFEPIDEVFSRDRLHVFYIGYQVTGADPKTARILSNDRFGHCNYIADSNSVFCLTKKYDEFCSFKMEGADPETFNVIDGIWAEDKNNVYKVGKVHKGAASVSGLKVRSKIVKLNDSFSKDARYVYWHGKAITKSDPNTFEVLFNDGSHSWAKDRINLYNANGHRIVKGIDGQSFVILDTVYGKDKNTVFSFQSQRLVPSADVKTFEVVLETGLGKDESNFFFMGKKISKNKYQDLSRKLLPFIQDLKALKKIRYNLWLDL